MNWAHLTEDNEQWPPVDCVKDEGFLQQLSNYYQVGPFVRVNYVANV
jgi:hypothetical protein